MEKAKNILKVTVYGLTILLIIIEVTLSLKLYGVIKDQVTEENIDRILTIVENQQRIEVYKTGNITLESWLEKKESEFGHR